MLLGDELCIAELAIIAVVTVTAWVVSPDRADSLRRCISATVRACGDRRGKKQWDICPWYPIAAAPSSSSSACESSITLVFVVFVHIVAKFQVVFLLVSINSRALWHHLHCQLIAVNFCYGAAHQHHHLCSWACTDTQRPSLETLRYEKKRICQSESLLGLELH